VKPLPPPYVPGKTEAEPMDNAVRKMFSASKEEILKREASGRKKRTKKAWRARSGIPSLVWYYGLSKMQTEKIGASIIAGLKLARMLLQLSDPNVGDPNDPDGERRTIEHAACVIGIVRSLIPQAAISKADRDYYEFEVAQLEESITNSRSQVTPTVRRNRPVT
jgi:hypothetical protein